MSGPVKQHLEGRRVHNNEEVYTAIREWMRMQEFNFPRNTKE